MKTERNVKTKLLIEHNSKEKEILNSGDHKYSDEEVKVISDFLWKFAELAVEMYYYQIESKQNEKSNYNGTRQF